ncbi:MAG: hypothetical protein M3458_02470 [Acidobacteriota bacterium]|nr:hypothetical protein [Acidobacteriota bacterium]
MLRRRTTLVANGHDAQRRYHHTYRKACADSAEDKFAEDKRGQAVKEI